MSSKTGKVFLVGAGPGDPELITLKGTLALQKSDVIIYDYLVNPIILNHSRPEVTKIYAGKKHNCHTMKQNEINQLMLHHAKQGKVITRLKGGDPFVLGRGGEEAEILAENDIPFEIIPGITSAIAVPAYAGIPVTHRDFASNVTIVTGHCASSKSSDNINWQELSNLQGTLVFLMGITNLSNIVEKLLQNGKPPVTPVALISTGCYKEQKTHVGNLKNINEIVTKENVQPPTVIVIGEVVNLSPKLGGWFEQQELPSRCYTTQ